MSFLVRRCTICGHLMNIHISKKGYYNRKISYISYFSYKYGVERWICAICNQNIYSETFSLTADDHWGNMWSTDFYRRLAFNGFLSMGFYFYDEMISFIVVDNAYRCAIEDRVSRTDLLPLEEDKFINEVVRTSLHEFLHHTFNILESWIDSMFGEFFCDWLGKRTNREEIYGEIEEDIVENLEYLMSR